MTNSAKPTAAQLRFLLAIAKDGGTSITAQLVVGSFQPINICRTNGWALVERRGDGTTRVQYVITEAGRNAARLADPEGYVAAQPKPPAERHPDDVVDGAIYAATVRERLDQVEAEVLAEPPAPASRRASNVDRVAELCAAALLRLAALPAAVDR